jgi:hypothetical protein
MYPQPGHLTVLPAVESSARSALAQFEHVNLIMFESPVAERTLSYAITKGSLYYGTVSNLA